MKRKILCCFLALAIVVSVFSINGFTESREPYIYRLVVAHFTYWQNDTKEYMYDDCNGERHSMGYGDPESYFVENYKFPVGVVDYNYKIADAFNLKYFKEDWSKLEYTALSEKEVKRHYMKSAVVDTSDSIGEVGNVKFKADFSPLSTKKAKELKENVYRSYVAVVVKYVHEQYDEDTGEWKDKQTKGNITVKFIDKDTMDSIKTTKKISLKKGESENYKVPDIGGYDYLYYKQDDSPILHGSTISMVGSSTDYEYVLYYENNGGTVDPPTPEPGEVNATLEMSVSPKTLTWNYKEWEENEPQKIKVTLDASGSTATKGIDHYEYKITILGKDYDFESTNGIATKKIKVYPEDVEKTGAFEKTESGYTARFE